jgi:hypothetical protein
MNCAIFSWPFILARSAGVLKPCEPNEGGVPNEGLQALAAGVQPGVNLGVAHPYPYPCP